MGRRRGRALALLAAVAGLTGGCALVIPMSGGISGRYGMWNAVGEQVPPASWTADPTGADPAFLDTAREQCLGFEPSADGGLVLQDQRGPDGAAFLFRGTGEATCLVLRAPGGALEATAATWSSAPGLPTGPIDVRVFTQGAVSAATGWVDPRAGTVELETADGVALRATIGGGRFVAWWPGPDEPAVIRAMRPDGSVLHVLDGMSRRR